MSPAIKGCHNEEQREQHEFEYKSSKVKVEKMTKIDNVHANAVGKFGASILYQFEHINLHGRGYELLHKIDQLKFRNDDIMLTMFPKSGSTWLSECIYLIVTQYNYEEALKESIEVRFPQIDSPSHDVLELVRSQLNQEGLERMIKSAIPANLMVPDCDEFSSSNDRLIKWDPNIKTSKPRVVTIFRNPRDILVSYYHHCKTFKYFDTKDWTFDQFFDAYIEGMIPCGPVWKWFNDSYNYHCKNKSSSMVIFYEDMKRDLRQVLSRICKFLNKQEPSNEEEWARLMDHLSVDKMRKNRTINRQDWDKLGLKYSNGFDFVRKGQVNDWKNFFSPKQVEIFEEKIIDKLVPELKVVYKQTN